MVGPRIGPNQRLFGACVQGLRLQRAVNGRPAMELQQAARPRDTGSTDRPRRPQTNLGRARPYPAGSTKLSSTILRPALSKSTVSLLPSMAAIVPGPNFWWKTRWPAAKPDSAPVDLATSSPSIGGGRAPGAARARKTAAVAAVVGEAATCKLVAALGGAVRLRALPARRRVGGGGEGLHAVEARAAAVAAVGELRRRFGHLDIALPAGRRRSGSARWRSRGRAGGGWRRRRSWPCGGRG